MCNTTGTLPCTLAINMPCNHEACQVSQQAQNIRHPHTELVGYRKQHEQAEGIRQTHL